MKRKIMSVLIVSVLMLSTLTGCFNKRANGSGIWWNPFSWGDHTLEQTLAKQCADGATETTIGKETYPCPGSPANTEPQPGSEAEAPASVRCESIQVSTDGGTTWKDSGLDLKTEAKYDIGDRTTWTSRSTLVPGKAYDEALSTDELKTVEQTWLDVRFNACNTEAVVFAGGFEMGNVKFDGGVLFSLKGEKQLRVRNGEVVLWHDTAHRDKDLGRVIDQIEVGNFDIHGPLALAVADGLKDVKVVADFLANRPDVKIVILP